MQGTATLGGPRCLQPMAGRPASAAAIAACVLTFPMAAMALDFSFYGRTPAGGAEGQVHVQAGVVPGIPVLFEACSPGQTLLRPAREDEKTTDGQPVYRFEWQADKSARFYELADPAVLEKLKQQNIEDTATDDGKAYEIKAEEHFFRDTSIIRDCLPAQRHFHGDIAAFFVISPGGALERAIVVPEGSAAECIARAAAAHRFPAPAKPFTMLGRLHITD